MSIIVTRDGLIGDVAGEIARLEGLLADLERIGFRDLPTTDELESAPLVDNYTLAQTMRACIVGDNHGHPMLRGRRICTTELWAFAPDHGWARTRTRLYRLGRPFRGGEER